MLLTAAPVSWTMTDAIAQRGDSGTSDDSGPSSSRSDIAVFALAAVSVLALIYYGRVTGWSPSELARFVGGALALWGPLAAVLFLLLSEQIPDRIVRFTLSGVASYTLTTLFYFAFAVLRFEVGFYVAQAGLAASVLVAAARRPAWWRGVRRWPRAWGRLDWLLIALVAASLVVNIRYQTAFSRLPNSDDLALVMYEDHLYHVGLAYELARHVPPVQQSIRAGIPERAYHMFSQLTTMLLGRFTGQVDLLRVHIIYHYIIIEAALCLLLYSLAVTLTDSVSAGHIAAALVYLGAVPWPRLAPGDYPSFYFTLYPYVSSGLDPVRMSSPQMYSGLVVMYGILLGVAVASRRFHRGTGSGVLLVVTALMVAASSRFRIHVFLPMLPGFVLIMAWAWSRRREWSYALSATVAVVGGALLLAEMRSRVYLPGTARLALGFNGVSGIDWVNSWPFAEPIFQWFQARIEDVVTLGWTWQVVALPAFVILNMIGVVPLAAMLVSLTRVPVRRELGLFTVLVVWLLAGSILGAMVLKMDYDPYSVGGQLLLHTCWYVVPFLGPAAWWSYRALRRRLRWPDAIWRTLALAGIVACVIGQQLTAPPVLGQNTGADRTLLDVDERHALGFLHEDTPPGAIVISNKYADRYAFVFTGLAGRAAYMEGGTNTVQARSDELNPEDNRSTRVALLWEIADADQFCALLLATPATHLVEFAERPLHVQAPGCLQELWVSPQRKVTIWDIAGRSKGSSPQGRG
jgi:hypothetical protein